MIASAGTRGAHDTHDAHDATQLAAAWYRRLSGMSAGAAPLRSVDWPVGQPELLAGAIAEFSAQCLMNHQTALLVVPDDAWLPAISNALDIELRPFCLVLPGADFVAAITLRATLSLIRSRLARPVVAGYEAVWGRQRALLDAEDGLWQEALAWSAAGFSAGPWPARIAALFPVLILPFAQWEALCLPEASVRDRLLMLHAERQGAGTGMGAFAGIAQAARALLLFDPDISLARALAPVDETRRLVLELEVLTQEMAELELEFATVQGELAEFTRSYHERVAHRLVTLDRLQAEIAGVLARQAPADAAARQEAGQKQAQAEQSQREHRRFNELDREREKPFAPSRDLKRLFRQVAQKIHPDRAEDEDDRVWRTTLMSEANRAYRAGDRMVLQDILEQWQQGRPAAQEAVPAGLVQRKASASEAVTALYRQIERVQNRIVALQEQLNRLVASRLYELFAAANLARSKGRDLLHEMAEQLEVQIEAARVRLRQLDEAGTA